MKHLFFLLLFSRSLLFAQVEQRYQAGAVGQENGKVVFRKEIRMPQSAKQQGYDSVLAWAQTTFNNDTNRVVYSDKEKATIAAVGERFLTFSSTSLALDRAEMTYRMVFQIEQDVCTVSIENIRYTYHVTYQREPERWVAEELITDEFALNKGKLNRRSGKFRTATIDFVAELFGKLESELLVVERVSVAQQSMLPLSESTHEAGASLSGYKNIAPDRIAGNIIKMLSEDWMLITAGKDSTFNMMTAGWGGLGHAFNKPVAFCFIGPSRHTYSLMEQYETYTLTFYTEAYRDVLHYCGSKSGKEVDKVKGSGLTPLTTPHGSKAFAEAWMIIECRKLVAQPLTPESIQDESVRKEWEGKPLHTMYIGEIVNVWIK